MASAFSYSNKKMGGGLQGMTAGASAGAPFGPWGAVIGGGLGLVAGWFGAAAEEDDAERRQEILDEAAENLGISYNEIYQTFKEFYDKYDLAKAYGYTTTNEKGETVVDLEKLGAVGKKIQNWDNQVNKRMVDAGLASYAKDPSTGEYLKDASGNPIIQYEDFTFDYKNDINGDGKTDVTDFLDPYAGNVIAASNRAVQHSAAGAGLGRSTGAAQAISENTAREYDKLYNTALSAYNQDRTQAYNEWAKALDMQNDRFKTLLQSDQWGIGQEKDLNKDIMELAGEEAQTLADVKREKAQTDAQIKIAGI